MSETPFDRPTPGDAPTANERFLSDRLTALERRQTQRVQTPEQMEAEVERRTQERVALAIESIPDALSEAVERALRRVLDDEQRQKAFWAAGYQEFEKHAGTNVAQWIGRRVINIIVSAAVVGLLAWAVVTGKHK